MLTRLRSIGEQLGFGLWSEGLYRHYDNRRQIASYSGLAPTPWQSGSVSREQGISKAGNPRLRAMLIELAWLWLKHQPSSALSLWYWKRVGAEKGRTRRVMIVAMARKLLIALWKYVKFGEIPEGAVFKAAA
jgi:transposase